MTDEEFTEIATKALEKIGVSDKNQFRLDIHNSTKQKHIHFIVNRIDISGKCTVKSHDVGRRFGEAVREVCKEKGLLTDVEIGIQKKAEMLKNLKETLKSAKNFDELIFKMKERGFEIQLSKNVKDGVSGMRIVMEKDKNPNTDRIYKAGYKLSEITSKLKIADIKAILNENRAKKLDNETVFSENSNQENSGNVQKNDSVISEVGKAIEEFLKPTYTSNSDDELLKKRRENQDNNKK
ncbi:relaxase/mobilization nuclease domain-containing protein [Chryseobacterium carnipullorum]|uniref:Relaxase/Mobilisation nuclease domain n=1 Tax=Chryseobacterium carnipullorum TaxID=1124835 RepID=A0A376EDS5_CHRCU|nr:relaxase/mobilization nuclease domain-containing protein [Chryseobacterium carnipullorum]STD06760.1 Relaxase/Mobilisation nuclease domain [Chryseobacterium carnipullorum]